MKKEAIYTKLKYPDVVFFYKGENGIYELFRTRWRKIVYEYFRYGKSVRQIYNDRSWIRYKLLSKLIEGRLQKEIRKARKEDVNAG